MPAEYDVDRPADPPHTPLVVQRLVGQVGGDLLDGTTTSRTLKLFFENFGPAGAAGLVEGQSAAMAT
jgi:hypothetical protein